MQDLNKTLGQLAVKLIGVNDASVLPIFCQTHDSNAFVPLEHMPFVATKEQCFLLAYRAVCHELSKKREVLNFVPTMKGFDRGMSPLGQMFMQHHVALMEKGYRVSLRDMDAHKQQFDSMLAARDYTDMRAFIISLGGLCTRVRWL
jgi:hypothetical protein